MDTKGLCIYLQWPFFLSDDFDIYSRNMKKEKSPPYEGGEKGVVGKKYITFTGWKTHASRFVFLNNQHFNLAGKELTLHRLPTHPNDLRGFHPQSQNAYADSWNDG